MHQKLYDVAADFLEHVIDDCVGRHLGKMESPIEGLFLEALVMNHFMAGVGFPHIDNVVSKTNDPVFGIKTQHKVGKYRADFLLVSWDGRCVLVECDGHNFHERTKEQAARDRKKDRTLQADGFVILRYTGSEIWADPMTCAADASRTLFKSQCYIVPKRVGFDLPLWMLSGEKYQEAFEEKMKHACEAEKKIKDLLEATA